MKFVYPHIELLGGPPDGKKILMDIERAGRICYKSEENTTETSHLKFVKKLIENGHEAMLEHGSINLIKFICDRGVSHEIVRHRLFSFAQESTRYCNYGGDDISFIMPEWIRNFQREKLPDGAILTRANFEEKVVSPEFGIWANSMLTAEETYHKLLKEGWFPQLARSVLPNSLKTEIVVSGNIRQWRHFFKLRLHKTAHPQMIEVAQGAFETLRHYVPVVFDDVYELIYGKKG